MWRPYDISATQYEEMARLREAYDLKPLVIHANYLINVAGTNSEILEKSIAALRASSSASAYAVSKAGLLMLAQTVARDFGAAGVRANVVCPGWTVTEMADEEMAAFGGERGLGVGAAYRLVTALVPQRRPAHADEVAAVISWLLSDAASYVNGAVIPVDGSAVAVDVGTVAFDPRVSLRERGEDRGQDGVGPGR